MPTNVHLIGLYELARLMECHSAHGGPAMKPLKEPLILITVTIIRLENHFVQVETTYRGRQKEPLFFTTKRARGRVSANNQSGGIS